MKRFLIGRLVFAIVSIVAATFIVLVLSRASGYTLIQDMVFPQKEKEF